MAGAIPSTAFSLYRALAMATGPNVTGKYYRKGAQSWGAASASAASRSGWRFGVSASSADPICHRFHVQPQAPCAKKGKRLASRITSLRLTERLTPAQNRLANRTVLWDSLGMTLKPKQLRSVDSGALSSVEEHFLHTEGVAGSSPAARTILFPQ